MCRTDMTTVWYTQHYIHTNAINFNPLQIA
jgi:hypothetical protein